MHFFVTGHTGFKGSWLILLLKEMGHEVSGYSLAPIEGGLFQKADLEKDVKNHFIGDIRDLDHLSRAIEACKPDFAIHMAAQPLVLRSYADPVETYTTNVDGTLNFLQAVTGLESPPISLVVTTDKVYRDEGKGSYSESDPLGGHDPYSASKAMADILTQSWAATNPDLKLHIARAGNVIGAFDVCDNRLIPDAIKAYKSNENLRIRNPIAVRPWQHVLDCLNGYLMFTEKSGEAPKVLNFGPSPDSFHSVDSVVREITSLMPGVKIEYESASDSLVETGLLTLDSSAAQDSLGWSNKLNFEDSISWALAELLNKNLTPKETVLSQIRRFLDL